MVATAASRTGSQSPVFARPQVSPLAKPLVSPLTVFAAGRGSFDVIVRKLILGDVAMLLIFAALPLLENGWNIKAATITRAGTSTDRWPIWRVSRT